MITNTYSMQAPGNCTPPLRHSRTRNEKLSAPISCHSCCGAVLPAAQFVENRSGSLQLRNREAITIVTGHEPNRTVDIAAGMITAELGSFTVRRSMDAPRSGIVIVLRDCEREGIPGDTSAADRELLATDRHFGQSYILAASSRGVRISGATGVAVLYGAATLIQLVQLDSDGLRIQAALIRDYPSFRYRAASDWLLRAELNQWAYDWGDGLEAYVKRIHRKLDFCARFKINMVMFDGFGWSTARRPGYAAIMREFNTYARDRGIKLMFAGFGANFDPRKVEPEFHIGRVILNRRSYPYGPVYQCFGEDRTAEHPTYGTCRSNDALLHEIASDFENFVRAVEPGALYVHHEDTRNFQSTQLRWAARCDECKRRWPNPDFAAADGGAGAMARGYENILRAVNSVRNTSSGYNAARDCTVVFISPPYGVDSNRSGMGKEAVDPSHNWNKTLEFWTNALGQMPKAPNVEVGFREIFAGSEGKQWIEVYRSHMLSRGLNPNTFLFFLGGADQYSDGAFGYPFTGSAAMDEIFDGAESIYSFNGGLHQEPQQVINAQYAWNSHAPGHIAPACFESGLREWHALLKNEELPDAIFAAGGVFDSACAQIYGVRAGAAMSRFQRFNQGRTSGDLPPFYPAKIYPGSVLWRLLGDALYGEAGPSDAEKKALDTLHLSRGELQNRLAAFWRQCAAVNKRGRNLLAEVAAAGDLRSDAQEDVQRLRLSLEAGEHIAVLMTTYHSFLAAAVSADAVESQHRSTLAWLQEHVRADFVDPKGGDASSWFEAVEAVRFQIAGRSM